MSDYVSKPDVTLQSHPEHHTVGKHFVSWGGEIFFCESHDQNGYWMFPTAGHDNWKLVSERAIGRTFHEIYLIAPGHWSSTFGRVHLPFKLEEPVFGE